MNISESLRKFAGYNHPIFKYTIDNVIDRVLQFICAEQYGNEEKHIYTSRLYTLIAISKAKALRHRFETEPEPVTCFNDLILQLCPDNPDLALKTTNVIETAIEFDIKIQFDRSRGIDETEFIEEDLDNFITGPLANKDDYDEFVSSALDYKDESNKDAFIDQVSMDFNEIISFDDKSERADFNQISLDTLNQMHIFKSKTIDIIKKPNAGFFLCVDANKRFNDGELIRSDSAWAFRQKDNGLSVNIIY